MKRNHNTQFSEAKFLVCILLSCSLVSCFKPDRSKNIFHYNETSGIASLDPAFAKSQSVMWADQQIYNWCKKKNSK